MIGAVVLIGLGLAGVALLVIAAFLAAGGADRVCSWLAMGVRVLLRAQRDPLQAEILAVRLRDAVDEGLQLCGRKQ